MWYQEKGGAQVKKWKDLSLEEVGAWLEQKRTDPNDISLANAVSAVLEKTRELRCDPLEAEIYINSFAEEVRFFIWGDGIQEPKGLLGSEMCPHKNEGGES